MKCSVTKFPLESGFRGAGQPLGNCSGHALLEFGCWILGSALILLYLAASAGLENQRSQGLKLFAEAQSAAVAQDRLEDLPLAPHSFGFANEQTTAAASITASPDRSTSLPIAVLRLASVGLEVPVYPDTSELNLSRGAGWIEGTAAPNAGSNMAVAAHRDRYFRPLKDVELGDILELESLAGPVEFRVSSIAIVDPDDVSVLDDTLVPTVTLVTCYPFYFIGNAPQRYIVQATAIEKPGKASALEAAPTALPPGESP